VANPVTRRVVAGVTAFGSRAVAVRAPVDTPAGRREAGAGAKQELAPHHERYRRNSSGGSWSLAPKATGPYA
jgi:hypothetical protein